MQSGEAIETGIVGADGLVGGDAAINGHLFGQMTVQFDGAALTMPKARFVDAYLTHPHLRNLVDRYQSILLVQAQQNGATGALGYVVAGWDRMGLPPFSAGFVSIAAVLALMPTGFLAARLGARVAHHVSRRRLELCFATYLIIVCGQFGSSLAFA
jgi:hypothetical protein